MQKALIALVFGFMSIAPSFAAEAANLAVNPGFDEPAGKLPAQWEPITFGSPAEFVFDKEIKRSGAASARITAAHTTRTYLRSKPIAVAPGEIIHASAWVKFKDVPLAQGTIIMIGEFSRGEKREGDVAKFNIVDRKATEGDWQLIEGSLAVPPLMRVMFLRLGFSYLSGTCWWDDLKVTTESPLAVRLDIDGGRLTPAMGAVPVSILNRAGRRGAISVGITRDKQLASENVELDGTPVQQVKVPMQIIRRGKAMLTAALYEPKGDKPIFTEPREVMIPPPLTLTPLSPTHWVIEDGPPTIEARIDIAISSADANGATLKLNVFDANQKSIASKSIDRIDFDGLNDVVLTAPKLGEGNYTVAAELTGRDGKSLTSEQPWSIIPRRRAKVTMNADGYPVYDGKVIFPIGIFNGSKFEEQAKAGFTITHAYNAVNVKDGEQSNEQTPKDFLDNTQQNGMKALFLIPRGYVFAGEWDSFRRRVRMFRNHPALLAWDEEEGIARGDMDLNALKKMVQIIHEEDPNHPIMIGDSRLTVGSVAGDRSNFFPAEFMDMGMWWWYPFPPKSASDDALAGEQKMTSELVLPSFFSTRTTDKPIWMGIQSYKKNPASRYPTPTEYRCQPYISFIEGAKGVMWYGGSVTGGLFGKPAEGHWDYLQTLVGELREMEPILMSPNADKPKVEPENVPMSVAIKRSPSGLVLIAVNRNFTPADVTFSSPDIRAGVAKVAKEDREIKTSSGKLKDHFEPLDVHIYMLPGK